MGTDKAGSNNLNTRSSFPLRSASAMAPYHAQIIARPASMGNALAMTTSVILVARGSLRDVGINDLDGGRHIERIAP